MLSSSDAGSCLMSVADEGFACENHGTLMLKRIDESLRVQEGRAEYLLSARAKAWRFLGGSIFKSSQVV